MYRALIEADIRYLGEEVNAYRKALGVPTTQREANRAFFWRREPIPGGWMIGFVGIAHPLCPNSIVTAPVCAPQLATQPFLKSHVFTA